jgi:hypothetical protein
MIEEGPRCVRAIFTATRDGGWPGGERVTNDLMSETQTTSRQRTSLFPYARWQERLAELAAEYRDNQPYPHVHLTAFLDEEIARQAAAAFPQTQDGTWIQWKHYNENKQGKNRPEELPPLLADLIHEFQAPEFVAWLSELTGIDGLFADPMLEGGGLHVSRRGGFLNVHTDFLRHHHKPDWRRRVNLLVYLSEGWQEEWGGHLELWDRQMRHCAAKYPPLLNHAVVFSTTDESYHGHPDPITCPEGEARKSIALYYYTIDGPGGVASRGTRYRSRPRDGSFKRLLIWLDTKLVLTYSFLKQRLNLSDGFASWLLGKISRK